MNKATWYVDVIELKEEISKTNGIISSKETRIAIIDSQSKGKRIEDFTLFSGFSNDKMVNQLIERDSILLELPKLYVSLEQLEKQYNKYMEEIKNIIEDEKSNDYLEVNIFYYRYLVYKNYTLEDIRMKLKLPYQESQIKLKSSQLTKIILEEQLKRSKNRTEIVLKSY